MSFLKAVKQFLIIMNQESVLWKNNALIQEGIVEQLTEINSRIVHLEKMIGIRK